jgi:hypothetical protein
MKLMKRLLPSLLALSFVCVAPRAAGVLPPQGAQAYALNGHVSLDAAAQLTARLYFPKSSGRPVLVAYTDDRGNFVFRGLPAGPCLLEVYSQSEMVYQKRIDIGRGLKLQEKLVTLEVVDDAGSQG